MGHNSRYRLELLRFESIGEDFLYNEDVEEVWRCHNSGYRMEFQGFEEIG